MTSKFDDLTQSFMATARHINALKRIQHQIDAHDHDPADQVEIATSLIIDGVAIRIRDLGVLQLVIDAVLPGEQALLANIQDELTRFLSAGESFTE